MPFFPHYGFFDFVCLVTAATCHLTWENAHPARLTMNLQEISKFPDTEPAKPDALTTFVQRVRTRVQAFRELKKGYFAAMDLFHSNRVQEADALLGAKITEARQTLQMAEVQAPELYNENELAKLFLYWETTPPHTANAATEHTLSSPAGKTQPSLSGTPHARNSASLDIASMIDQMLEGGR